MATEVARVVAKLEADIRNFESGMKKAEKRLEGVEKSSKKTSRSMGDIVGAGKKLAIAAGLGFGLQKGVKFVESAVGAFSDLEQSAKSVERQFCEGADTIQRFGETAADSLALSKAEFNTLAVTTGAVLSGFIDDQDKAARATIRLTERARDFATTYQITVPQAIDAFSASIRGQQDAVAKFGVQISTATVEAKALELGLGDATGVITDQDKAVARLELLYEQTAGTQGAFADSSDDLATRQERVNAKMKDLQATIGEALVPAVIELAEAFEDLIPSIEKAGPELAAFVAGAIRGVSFLGNVASSVVNLGQGLVDVPRLVTGSTRAFDQFAAASRAGQGALDDLTNAQEPAVTGLAVLGDASQDLSFRIDGTTDAWTRHQQAQEKVRVLAVNVEDQFKQGVRNSLIAAADAADQFREGQRNLAFESAAAAIANNKAAAAADDVARSYGSAADFVRDLTRAQQESINPVAQLLRADARLVAANERLNELENDRKASTADVAEAMLSLVEAQADVIGARGQVLSATGENIEAFRRMAEQANLTKEQIDLLIASLTGIHAVVGTQITVGTRRAAVTGTGGGAGGGVIGGNIALQHGGIVTQPTQAIIGEAGPEAVIPLDRAGQLGGGDTFNVTVDQSIVVQDDATAAQRILEETQDALDALAAGRA